MSAPLPLQLPVGFPTDVFVVEDLPRDLLPSGTWTLVGDAVVRNLWRDAGLPEPPGTCWVRVDEGTKRLETLLPWLETWAALPLDRQATVVAFGGGILTDLVGLAAALYMRGIAWQAWPTTLLSQVDAGLGGKTAVNLQAGKNLAGAFHPPVRMVVSRACLRTLPPRQVDAGFWEVAKMALVEGDIPWVTRLLAQPAPSPEDMARALREKAHIVHRDPLEQGERRLLNLGHTLGHALEAGSRHALLHGEAVGLGLLAACLLARHQGLPGLDPSLLHAMAARLAPLAPHLSPWETCLPLLARDKKAARGGVHCILPRPGERACQRLLPPDAWRPAHHDLCALLS